MSWLMNSDPLSKSGTVTSKTMVSIACWRLARTLICALSWIEAGEHQPRVHVVEVDRLANLPLRVGPQRATASPSKNLGLFSPSSPALRIVIEDLSGGDGRVAEAPQAGPFAWTGAR